MARRDTTQLRNAAAKVVWV